MEGMWSWLRSCPMSTMTLKMGIEKTLLEKVPGVKEVVQVK